MTQLPREFFARPAQAVAQELLGQRLVRELDGHRLAAVIVETEAYGIGGEHDLACHASRNNGKPTQRTRVMFGPAGHVYMYFCYGTHWMLNIVTGEEGEGTAVLVRAVHPLEGLSVMKANRSRKASVKDVRQLTNGPGKLAQALDLNGDMYGHDMCNADSQLWVELARMDECSDLRCGARVGISAVPEPWLSKPWRYWLPDSVFVSAQAD